MVAIVMPAMRHFSGRDLGGFPLTLGVLYAFVGFYNRNGYILITI